MQSLGMSSSTTINICDREEDMYEFFDKASELNSNFIVRASVNRCANDATVAEEMVFNTKQFRHRISFQNSQGELIDTMLKVRVKQLTLHPPIAKSRHYSSMPVTVISAYEDKMPQDRERIR